MHTLGLTSPHTKGPEVKHLQELLEHNWMKKDCLMAEVDGDFGPTTGRGCIRAKYWLGYPTGKQQPVAGGQLFSYLSSEAALPVLYRARRSQRLKAAAKKPLRVKALERAERDLGMKEIPMDSNHCPISDRWGMVGPWCAMAVSTWYIDAGSKAFTLHVDWAFVPSLLQAAELGQHGLSLVKVVHALPGDAVTFDWDGDGVADHIGLLESAIHSDGNFETIEGNTSVGNDSNGGQVMRRSRVLSSVARHHNVLGLVRVGR